jgi:signal transduction histidine kinase
VAQWCRSHGQDVLTAVALPLILVVNAPPGHWPSGWDVILAIATWAPLTVRMRWPLPVAVTVGALDTAQIALAGHEHPATATLPVATMLALYTVSVRCPARTAWLTAAVTAAVWFITAVLSLKQGSAEDLLYLNWAGLPVVVGRLTREREERITAAEQRAEAAERGQAAEAQRQVTAERMRIARDLHDVLAHHITVVNAQASVAQYLLSTDPAAAEEALAGIADNSRAALDELRATLGLLRSPDDSTVEADQRAPAPGAGQLAALAAGFTTAGMSVAVRSSGTPRPLAPAADLAIYRIAQEALTNASKHAPGSDAEVVLAWTEQTAALTVTNTAPAAARAGPVAQGTGHGLIGMRERAASAGGTITFGPTADGGYQVAAVLPVSGAGLPATGQGAQADATTIATPVPAADQS